jgi:hypothetical protein
MLDERLVFVREWLLSQKKREKEAVQKHLCDVGSAEDIEMWADVQGYEGRYQVSNLGRVKSLARTRRGKNGGVVPMLERLMRLTPKKDNGRTKPYVEVRFRNGGTRKERCKAFLVHRLVAAAFIKPLEPGEQVDHINGLHNDNRAVNLRVMKSVEHARLHPCLTTPNSRDPKTGWLVKAGSA